MNTFTRFLTLLASLLFSVSCGAIDLGFLDLNSKGEIYLHTTKSLDQKDRITVLNNDQEKSCCLRFSGRNFLKADVSENVFSDDDGRPVIRYKLIPTNRKIQLKPQVYASVVGNTNYISIGKEDFTLVSSSKRYVVETCYGMEGMNLYLKRQGKQIQHLYYYFNMDLESNCK